jgi:tight adherence protein B
MSRRTLLHTAVLSGLLAVGLLHAAPAQAAGELSIDHVEVTGDGTVSVLLGVDRLPGGAMPDLGSLRVTVDGGAVAATGETVKAGQVRRTTVLALDASNSMAGARFQRAKAAALAFLEEAPADVRIGLLTFSGQVGEPIPPTTDRQVLGAAIEAIRLTRGTRLYSAVVEAVHLAGNEGARSVLLLSDGRDDGGGVPLDDALDAVADGEVIVDAVAVEQDSADRALLARISDASGGEVVSAVDSSSLRSVFTAEADALADQVLVRFPRGEQGSNEATNEISLEVSLSADGTTYDDSAFLSLTDVADVAGEGPRAVASAAPGPGRLLMFAGVAALGLGLATILGVALLGRRGPTSAQQRLASYLGEAHPTRPASLKESVVSFAGTVVRGDFESRLAQRLAGAGIALTAAEWVLLHAGLALGSGLAGLVLGGGVFMVILLLAGSLLPAWYLRVKHSRRLAAFGAQLPETLTLMAGGLSAGLSLKQAIDTVVREGHEPMASELRRALVEHRLGIDIEETLDGVADRMGSTDFAWVVMAVRIQRDVGGNLSEVLTTVADTIREREYLRRQVRSLSAEGRLSAWILGVMPVAMFLYMLVANRDFVRPLYTEPLGWLMLAAAGFLLSSGSWAMSRLVKVEV